MQYKVLPGSHMPGGLWTHLLHVLAAFLWVVRVGLDIPRSKIGDALCWNSLEGLASPNPGRKTYTEGGWTKVTKAQQTHAREGQSEISSDEEQRAGERKTHSSSVTVWSEVDLQLLWLWSEQRGSPSGADWGWMPAHLPLLSYALWHQPACSVGRGAFSISLYVCKLTQAVNQS